MAYRDDLEAAQARASALEREVANLKRRNAELEDEVQRVWEQKPEENPEPLVIHSEPEHAIAYPSRIAASSIPMVVMGAATFVLGVWGGLVLLGLGGVVLAVIGVLLARR